LDKDLLVPHLMTAALTPNVTTRREKVSFLSMGQRIQALLQLPAEEEEAPYPVLIVSHGAGEFKENYIELAEYLAHRGIATLMLDMHGHGESEGPEYCIQMKEWVSDIRAALNFTEQRVDLDNHRVAAFGLSSGGTAILETAVVDSRLKALVALDATVMDTLPFGVSVLMRSLSALGRLKRLLTGKHLRISLISMLDGLKLASDPEINKRLQKDPGKLRAFASFPLPGASQAFIVDTIKRVDRIQAPTLVIWGEDDELDPISTAHRLHDSLKCVKGLEIVPGNGHVGHLDRHRERVFELTANWLRKHLG
jgi:alpha-beta hydrolase superfamily lysophospholipase